MNVSRIGANPNDSDEVRVKKAFLAVAICSNVPVGLIWGTIYLSFGEPLAAACPFSAAVLSVLNLLLFSQTKHINLAAQIQAFLVLILPFGVALVLGSFANSSAVVLWSVLAPLGALLILKLSNALLWMLAYLSVLVLSLVLEPYLRATNNLPPSLIRTLFALNLGSVSFVFAFLLYYFVNQKDHLYALLHMEQAKSEGLLLNILPKEIVTRLKQGEETIADRYDSVSIMFVDLVDFTPLSAIAGPKAMAELLSRIFSTFDQLVEKYGVEKIETAGDSYMIASGLPAPCSDHAAVITRLALDIRSYFDQGIVLQGQQIHCRIGISSGPAMAGVIERKKISYNVWGDTVNTASRMQTHSLPSQIQISQITYELIKDDFICESRGTINVKGKGEMEVWLVISAKADQRGMNEYYKNR